MLKLPSRHMHSLISGASAQGAGGAAAPQKKLGRGGAPPPQTKKHRKAQKNDESALRAKEVIYYQCVTGVTRPPPQSKFGADAPEYIHVLEVQNSLLLVMVIIPNR